MKYFTKTIDKYFASWILPGTWHTKHWFDMARFYRFVFAIDYFSKPIESRTINYNDPAHAKCPECVQSKLAKFSSDSRNPRTFDEQALKKNIMLAVKRNHTNFDETYAEKLIDNYVKKAIIILDALWAVKYIGFPQRDIQKWEPPLK